MIKKDEIDLAKSRMLKALRSYVRLKHSLAADAELNEVLPEAELAFDKLIQQGFLPDDVDLKALVSAVVGDA